MEGSSKVSKDAAGSKTTRENDDQLDTDINADNESSFDNIEDDKPTLSEDSTFQSESEDYKDESDLHQENETSRSDEEELLYQGSKTSKILSFVLIVSSTTICIKQLGQIFFNC